NVMIFPLIFLDSFYDKDFFSKEGIGTWKNNIFESMEFVFAAFPISDNPEYKKINFNARVERYNSLSNWNTIQQIDRDASLLHNLRKLALRASYSGVNRFIISVDDNINQNNHIGFLSKDRINGRFSSPVKNGCIVNWVTIDRLTIHSVYAHELGHSLGLWRKPFPQISEEYLTPKWSSGRSTFGFWVNEKRYRNYRLLTNSPVNFMGHARDTSDVWVDKEDYRSLIDVFTKNSLDPEIIQITGTVYVNDSLILDAWLRYNSDNTDLATETDSTYYRIKIRDSQGNIIKQYGFNRDFFYTNDYGDVDTSRIMPFIVKIPFISSFHKIEICDSSGKILAFRLISPNNPTINIVSPKGGEIYKGDSIPIHWTSNDIDGDSLTYFLYISSDNGVTWFPASLEDIKSSTYLLDTYFSPDGTKYKIKVVVSDGVNTAEAVSDSTFSIQKLSDIEETSDRTIQTEGYPNPFSTGITIKYSVFTLSNVILEIYDIFGSKIATLVNQKQEPGVYSSFWDATGYGNNIYFYCLKTGNTMLTRKIELIK
ncbi:MAG: T9SS type A sorting domain-containing protein, partial [Bacteroidota bacterium]